MRQLFGLLVLALVYIVLALVLAEAGLHVLGSVPPPEPAGSFWNSNVPETGWSLKPGAEGRYYNAMGEYDQPIRINEMGLRSPDGIAYAKPTGVYRILVLGDSYVEALQVSLAESFPQQLAQKLAGAGLQVEVVNAGVSGWGTDQQLLWLRNEGVKYAPDLVLLAVYPGNDFMNNYMPLESANFGRVQKPYFELQGETLVLQGYPYDRDQTETGAAGQAQTIAAEPAPALRAWGQWLHTHSELVRYLDPRLREMAPSLAVWLGRQGLIEPGQETAIADQGASYIPVAYGVYRQPVAPEWEQAFAVSGALFKAVKDEAAAMGAATAAVLLTAPEQVDPLRWQKSLERYPAMQNLTWDTNQSTATARRLLADAGIPVVDLLPQFQQAAAAGNTLHLRHDGHWTPASQALAGAAAASFLVNSGVVPVPAGSNIEAPATEKQLDWRRLFAWAILVLLLVSLVWSIWKTGLKAWLRNAGVRVGTVGELLLFVLRRRQFLLLPLLLVLVIFGALLIIAQSSVVGPFIYTLF